MEGPDLCRQAMSSLPFHSSFGILTSGRAIPTKHETVYVDVFFPDWPDIYMQSACMLTNTMTGRRRHNAILAKEHALMFDESFYPGTVSYFHDSYSLLMD